MTPLNTLLKDNHQQPSSSRNMKLSFVPPNLFASPHAEETREKNKDSLSTPVRRGGGRTKKTNDIIQYVEICMSNNALGRRVFVGQLKVLL